MFLPLHQSASSVVQPLLQPSSPSSAFQPCLSFFCRPAELLDQTWWAAGYETPRGRSLLWGVIVETEAYSQMNLPATVTGAAHCRTKPCLVSQGGFMYVSYGIHHCVNVWC